MNQLDWVIAAWIVLSTVLAAAQGFFFEAFSLAGVIVGYLAAAWGYTRAAVWFVPLVKSAWVADIAGFLAIFFCVVLVAGVAARIARWSAKEAGLRWFDRMLGAAFGLVRGVLVAAVLMLVLTAFAPDSPWLARSTMGPYVLMVARGAVWVAPESVSTRFHAGLDTLRELRLREEPDKKRFPRSQRNHPGSGVHE